MEWAYKSDVGCVRSHNEDNVFIDQLDDQLMVVVVADGMGGHRAGDVASQMATQVVKEQLLNITAEQSIAQLQDKLLESVEEANRRILHKSHEDEAFAGMGTTLVVAIIKEHDVLIGHIGDSRAYLVNEEECQQLTRDHSLVNELLNLGEITEVEAQGHPQKNILVRALGTDRDVQADVVHRTWEEGDYVLVCTDGLTNMVPDEALHAVIGREERIEWKVNELVRLALEAGGEDNISLALVKRTVIPHGSVGPVQETG